MKKEEKSRENGQKTGTRSEFTLGINSPKIFLKKITFLLTKLMHGVYTCVN